MAEVDLLFNFFGMTLNLNVQPELKQDGLNQREEMYVSKRPSQSKSYWESEAIL